MLPTLCRKQMGWLNQQTSYTMLSRSPKKTTAHLNAFDAMRCATTPQDASKRGNGTSRNGTRCFSSIALQRVCCHLPQQVVYFLLLCRGFCNKRGGFG